MFRPPVFPPHPSSSAGFKGRATTSHSSGARLREEGSTPRPRTLPNIIGFDGFGMKQIAHHSRTNGYFPPRKTRSSKGTPRSNLRPAKIHQEKNAEESLVLDTNSGVTSPRPYTGGSSLTSELSKNYDNFTSRTTRNTPGSFTARFTPDSSVHIPDKPTFQTENNNSSGDLSYLVKPKHIEPGRHSPWVYRYKVKRSMNSLSKIMSSPSPAIPSVAVRLER